MYKKPEGKERKGGESHPLCCSTFRFVVFEGKRRCPSSLLSAEIQYFGYRISYVEGSTVCLSFSLSTSLPSLPCSRRDKANDFRIIQHWTVK